MLDLRGGGEVLLALPAPHRWSRVDVLRGGGEALLVLPTPHHWWIAMSE